MNSQQRENLYIATLASFLFFHTVDFMIIMPLGPTFIKELAISSQQFSFLVSSYNFAAALSGILGLWWMDRLDRKLTLLIMVLCFNLGTALCGLATTYEFLLGSRMVAGAFGGMIHALCLTIIGDLVPFSRRAFALGKMMTAFSLGAILGIPSGLMLSNHWGWRSPFLALSILATFGVVLAWYILPTITAHLKEKSQTPTLAAIRSIITTPINVRCFMFTASLMFSQFTVIPFIGTVLVQNLDVDQEHLPWVYFVGGLATAFTGPLIGRLADAYRKELVFKICAVLAFLPILAITHIQHSSFILTLTITTLFFIFISGRMSPALALVISVVEPQQRGRFLGFNAAVQQAAAGIGTSVAGALLSMDAQGRIQHFSWVGYIAVAAGLLSLVLVNRLRAPA